MQVLEEIGNFKSGEDCTFAYDAAKKGKHAQDDYNNAATNVTYPAASPKESSPPPPPKSASPANANTENGGKENCKGRGKKGEIIAFGNISYGCDDALLPLVFFFT